MRVLIPLLLLVFCAGAQVPANRVTFSGGWARQTGASYDTQSAPALGLSYGYRVTRFVEAEAGVHTVLNPTGQECASYGCVDIDDHFVWIPFGVRFVAPLYRGRVEFSGGGGGLYEKYTVGNQMGGGPSPRSGWGGYFVGSAAVALDHSRHFWLGATPRWFLANPPYARDRWFALSGEVSFRF